MKRDTVNYLAVGSFVLAMFVLFLVALYKITGRDANAAFYYLEYRQIPGIIVGSTVTYGGYQVGRVNKISPLRAEGETRYRLELAIREGWQIPKDSVAYIVMPALLSDRQIDIVAGKSPEFLAKGETIASGQAADFMEAMKKVAIEINDLSEKTIKPLFASIQKPLAKVGSELETNIPQITANLNTLLARLNESAAKINQLMGEKNQAHLGEVLANAETISKGFAGVAENFSELQGKLDGLLDSSQEVLGENREDLRKSVIEMRTSLALIAERLDTILYHLEGTSRNMNELSRSLRENPSLIIRGGSVETEKKGEEQ